MAALGRRARAAALVPVCACSRPDPFVAYLLKLFGKGLLPHCGSWLKGPVVRDLPIAYPSPSPLLPPPSPIIRMTAIWRGARAPAGARGPPAAWRRGSPVRPGVRRCASVAVEARYHCACVCPTAVIIGCNRHVVSHSRAEACVSVDSRATRVYMRSAVREMSRPVEKMLSGQHRLLRALPCSCFAKFVGSLDPDARCGSLVAASISRYILLESREPRDIAIARREATVQGRGWPAKYGAHC